MSSAEVIAIFNGLIALIGATAAAIIAVVAALRAGQLKEKVDANHVATEELHVQLNSRMSELVAATKSVGRLEGQAEAAAILKETRKPQPRESSEGQPPPKPPPF